jgi:hypothetical protein
MSPTILKAPILKDGSPNQHAGAPILPACSSKPAADRTIQHDRPPIADARPPIAEIGSAILADGRPNHDTDLLVSLRECAHARCLWLHALSPHAHARSESAHALPACSHSLRNVLHVRRDRVTTRFSCFISRVEHFSTRVGHFITRHEQRNTRVELSSKRVDRLRMRVEAFRGRVERRNTRVERFNVSVRPIITVRGPNSEDDAEQIAHTEFLGVCPSLSDTFKQAQKFFFQARSGITRKE